MTKVAEIKKRYLAGKLKKGDHCYIDDFTFPLEALIKKAREAGMSDYLICGSLRWMECRVRNGDPSKHLGKPSPWQKSRKWIKERKIGVQ